MREESLAAIVAALGLLLLTGNASAQQSAGNVPFVMPLVGRTLDQVVEQYGRPIEAIPLFETGGRLLIFETPHGDRYIIETDVSGHVISAAVKHPEHP
jgi:hypothetical protein